jgi:hypothetical protein
MIDIKRNTFSRMIICGNSISLVKITEISFIREINSRQEMWIILPVRLITIDVKLAGTAFTECIPVGYASQKISVLI